MRMETDLLSYIRYGLELIPANYRASFRPYSCIWITLFDRFGSKLLYDFLNDDGGTVMRGCIWTDCGTQYIIASEQVPHGFYPTVLYYGHPDGIKSFADYILGAEITVPKGIIRLPERFEV